MAAKLKPRVPRPSVEERLKHSLGALANLRRDAILEAIAVSAEELLRSLDLRASLPKVVEQVGQAAGVDRLHIFEVDAARPLELGFVAQHYVWSAPGIETSPDFRSVGKSMAEIGLSSWISRLKRGETVVGHTRDFDPSARSFMESGGVKSALAIPIIVEDRWWGIIGFDDCRSERDWRRAEIDILKILAELVSAAITSSRRLLVLADANRIVENSPTLVYRLGPQAPFPLVFVSHNISRYGYDAEELLAVPQRWQQLIHADDISAAMANIASIVEGKTEYTRLEFRLKKPDDSDVWFDGEAIARRDADGRLTAIEGVITDITSRKLVERDLASSHVLLRAAIENSPEAILVVDQNGKVTAFNQHFLAMWNIPAELMHGSHQPLLRLGASFMKNEKEFLAGVQNLYEHNELECHDELSTKDGRTLERHATSLYDGERHFLGRIFFFRDITQRKTAQQRLASSQVLLATAIENSPDAVVVINESGRITAYNDNFLDLWRIPQEVMRGAMGPLLKMVASIVKNESEFLASVNYLYTHPELKHHDELETKDGRTIERHSAPLYDSERNYLGRIWFLRDITERKASEQKIINLSHTDALTGLPNRIAFLDRLHLAFARAKRGANRFAVLYLDLDHFKDVNDTLGHPAGDALLRIVGERLKSCVRETDVVARFGGDEFALLQEDMTDIAGTEALATKICRIIAVPMLIDGNQIHTSASVGIVPYRGDIADPEAMMTKADLALYRAKSEGRAHFRFHMRELDEEVRERVNVGEGLHAALERSEFELYYQPQVELESGRIVGLEALLRWNHPKLGLMAPDKFIPIAESTGSIIPIGQWVIEQTCRQIAQWREEGLVPPVVSANISAGQLKFAGSVDGTLADALARFGVAASELELELTETVLMEATQRHSEELARLRATGVRITIDDFGTGYSSLDYLRSFRVARLKIDRRFIEGVTYNSDDAAIVRAVIGLANELGIEVIAEGVETAEQRAFLLSAGCRLGQGFYFGAPMPVAATTALLREGAALGRTR